MNAEKNKNKIVMIFAILGLILTLSSGCTEKSEGFETSPEWNDELETTSITNTQTEQLLYDGTYTGTFNYEYRDTDLVYDKFGPWTPASFTLTLTFETIGRSDSPVDPEPCFYLDATNAIVSNPDFGTGSNGINPSGGFGEDSAWLPLNPEKRNTVDVDMLFTFPNGASIFIEAGGIIVSPDGKTLSSNPDFISVWGDHQTWKAETDSGSLWSGTSLEPRNFVFNSWSLTKVS